MSWFSQNTPTTSGFNQTGMYGGQNPQTQLAAQRNPFPGSVGFNQSPGGFAEGTPGAAGGYTSQNPADYGLDPAQYQWQVSGAGSDSPGMGGGFVPVNGGNSGGGQARDTGIAGRIQNGGGQAPQSGNPTDRNYVRSQISNLMQQHGVTPGGRGSGPADLEYYTDQAMQTGGWTPDNSGYWTDRWQSDARGGGGSGGGGGMGGMTLGGSGFGSMLAPYTGQAPGFQAPTGIDYMNDPGYQERMQAGADVVQNSAFARGKGLTGGALKDLTEYGQMFGSNEYGNVFNRALQGYGTQLNQFDRNYDIFRNNQTDPFNKLYSLTGLGFNAAGQSNAAADAYGRNIGNSGSAYRNIGDTLATNQGNVTIGVGNAQAGGALNRGQNNAGMTDTIGGIMSDPSVQEAMSSWYRRNPQTLGSAGYSAQIGT